MQYFLVFMFNALSTTNGYGSLTLDLTIKGQFKGQVNIPKGRTFRARASQLMKITLKTSDSR